MEFVALDVETANSQRASICSIGYTLVADGQVVSSHSQLVKPPPGFETFDGRNIGIHGITPSMVESAPSFGEVLTGLAPTLFGKVVVAHNAAFDIGAIRQACTASGLDWPEMTYGCTLVLARRILSLPSYSLPLVCSELNLDLENHHEAGSDSLAAAEIALSLAKLQGVSSIEELSRGVGVRLGTVSASQWGGCVRKSEGGPRSWTSPPLPSTNVDADPEHPLFAQVVVFTGALSMARHDAWDVVAKLGAIPEKGVTKKTTMLVVGDGFEGKSLADFHTGKAEKATKLHEKGQNIEIVNEFDFYQMLDEN